MEEKTKKYVLTAAQCNAAPHKEFINNLRTYCSLNGADLLILPIPGRRATEDSIDSFFYDFNLVRKDTFLNKRLLVKDYKVRPQQIDPVTGLTRFPQKDKSTIIPNPKQRMKLIPNTLEELPKILMSTGACTRPRYMNDRIGNIATGDHVYGGIVVEVLDDEEYNFRHFKATNKGEFIDLGFKYSGDKPLDNVVTEALVLGDIHVGDLDPETDRANYEMIEHFNPKRVLLHDLFNGYSISHHDENRLVTKAKKGLAEHLSLEDELRLCYEKLLEFAETGKEILIVASNHDYFLDRYLDSGRWVQDSSNAYIASQLFKAAVEGKMPLAEGIQYFGDLPDNISFLDFDEDFKVYGYQLGVHGHFGANGARRSSATSRENSYGKSITGHSHTPEMLRDTYIVGTSTKLKLDYMCGPSSWMHTNAVLYNNTKVQLINIIDGRWRCD